MDGIAFFSCHLASLSECVNLLGTQHPQLTVYTVCSTCTVWLSVSYQQQTFSSANTHCLRERRRRSNNLTFFRSVLHNILVVITYFLMFIGLSNMLFFLVFMTGVAASSNTASAETHSNCYYQTNNNGQDEKEIQMVEGVPRHLWGYGLEQLPSLHPIPGNILHPPHCLLHRALLSVLVQPGSGH